MSPEACPPRLPFGNPCCQQHCAAPHASRGPALSELHPRELRSDAVRCRFVIFLPNIIWGSAPTTAPRRKKVPQAKQNPVAVEAKCD